MALAVITRSASKNAQLNSAAMAAYATLKPSAFSRAFANLSAIVPAAFDARGGATIKMGGTGMPGSIGARLIARTSEAMPCAEWEALC